MKRKILIAILLGVLTGLAWLATLWLDSGTSDKLFYSTVTILALFLLFSVGIEEFGVRWFSGNRMRYSFRKTVSFLLILVIAIVIMRIWIPNPQALLVAYGVIAAGIAIALQDLVKNVAGTVTIFLGGIYQVGNRVEINDTYGDVIDIGLFNTTLLEVREWIDADQATGRITTVPNGAVLSRPIQNYTKHHEYLWDELSVSVTSESDRREAMRIMSEAGVKHTKAFVEEADKSLTNLERYYYIEGHVLDPNVYMQPDENGYKITLRYVVNAWMRRSTNSAIWEDIITVFETHPNISIAPPTYATIDYPDVSKKRGAKKKVSVARGAIR